MKTKELGWKNNQAIQNTGTEDSQANKIVDHRQVLKMWENYITELLRVCSGKGYGPVIRQQTTD
jgi:hypothetical protein